MRINPPIRLEPFHRKVLHRFPLRSHDALPMIVNTLVAPSCDCACRASPHLIVGGMRLKISAVKRHSLQSF